MAAMTMRALCSGGRVACRRITRRGFQQTGQHGRFDMCQILHRAVEIGFRCRLHTISAAAEIDAIEIERQNILFGKMRLQPKGQQQFLHFTFETALRCQENIFRQLLGQGRAALRQTPLSEIDRHGARQPARVEAEMGKKAPVFNGDNGLNQMRREIFKPHGPSAARPRRAPNRHRAHICSIRVDCRSSTNHPCPANQARNRKPKHRQQGQTIKP